MNVAFWKGKRVFMTGHTGFNGAWLSLWLQSLGAEVTGYSLAAPSEPNLFDVASVAKGMNSIEGDVRDAASLQAAMLAAQPEVVFHLAAQAQLGDSFEHPVDTYATNVMGTVNLLESIRQCPSVQAAVIVTSDKCYDNKDWHWGYRENDAMGGFDPYSSSKGCAELVTESYRHSFFNPEQYETHGVAIATARAGNVIGGGDWAKGRLIPDVIDAFTKRAPVVLRNPESTRPWQHLLESLGAYLLLAERLSDGGHAYAEAWNFGPNEVDTKPTGLVVDLLADAWKDNVGALIQHDKDAIHEAVYLRLDCSKAHSKLGWYPIWPIERAIVHVADWYMAYHAEQDMRAFTLQQIQQYQAQWERYHDGAF